MLGSSWESSQTVSTGSWSDTRARRSGRWRTHSNRLRTCCHSATLQQRNPIGHKEKAARASISSSRPQAMWQPQALEHLPSPTIPSRYPTSQHYRLHQSSRWREACRLATQHQQQPPPTTTTRREATRATPSSTRTKEGRERRRRGRENEEASFLLLRTPKCACCCCS